MCEMQTCSKKLLQRHIENVHAWLPYLMLQEPKLTNVHPSDARNTLTLIFSAIALSPKNGVTYAMVCAIIQKHHSADYETCYPLVQNVIDFGVQHRILKDSFIDWEWRYTKDRESSRLCEVEEKREQGQVRIVSRLKLF